MGARTSIIGLLCAGTLLAGCQSTVPGAPSTQAGPPPSSPAADAQALPDDNGYSFVMTKSKQTKCQLDVNSVGCEAQFAAAPVIDGVRATGVETTADGKNRWLVGNLGDPPVVVLEYRTYTAQGWTIVATDGGTRFTNDRTRHGMFVSLDKVEFF